MDASDRRSTLLSVELGAPGQPLLVRWCTWEPPWGDSGHNDSYALLTPEGTVLVDPDLPSPAADASLWSLIGAPPVAIVLTTDWHERDSYALRERFGAPVWAPAAGDPSRGGGLEGIPDHLYEDRAGLPGGLRAHPISGSGNADHALAWTAPDGTGVLFTGDILNGPTDPRHPGCAGSPRQAPGLYLGASPEHLQSLNHRRLQRGLASLRPHVHPACSLVCGGHGAPFRGPFLAALERLVSLDWRQLGSEEPAYPRR